MANQCYQCGKDVGFFTGIVWVDPDDSSKEIFFCSKVCHEEHKGVADQSNNSDNDRQTVVYSSATKNERQGAPTESSEQPIVSIVLMTLGWLQLICGFILLIYFLENSNGFMGLVSVVVGIFSWAVLVGFGTVIKLLHQIKNKP
jgi:ribosomal protein L24E